MAQVRKKLMKERERRIGFGTLAHLYFDVHWADAMWNSGGRLWERSIADTVVAKLCSCFCPAEIGLWIAPVHHLSTTTPPQTTTHHQLATVAPFAT
jgi:hypothetical protein